MAEAEYSVISRAFAKAEGLKYFFTGKLCKRGHVARRFVSCGICIQCSAEKSAEWYSDRDRSRLKTRRWREKNQDRDRRNAAKWRALNKEKIRKKQRAWSVANREKEHLKTRRWYVKNVEAQRKRGRDKREKNIEKYRRYSREYNALNPERIATIARNRRARQRANGGIHSIADIADIQKAQKGKCAYCRIRLTKKNMQVDHIIALANGGSNDRKNLQLLCISCNQRKSARDPIEFLRDQGKLL